VCGGCVCARVCERALEIRRLLLRLLLLLKARLELSRARARESCLIARLRGQRLERPDPRVVLLPHLLDARFEFEFKPVPGAVSRQF
jgi:hypothetical protein